MIKKRKAQGMGIKVIVIAIIALIVLVAIVMMFTGKFGDFGGGLESVGNPSKLCSEQTIGGRTASFQECADGISILSRDAGEKGEKCCLPKP